MSDTRAPHARGSTLFLKSTVYLLAATVLALCISMTFVTYRDTVDLLGPVLLFILATGIPFYSALYQTLKLLGLIDKNQAFSQLSVKALKNIKYCALIIASVYTVSMPLVFYLSDKDDAPGGVVIALGFIIAAIAVATFATVLQKMVQTALDLKSENDLTV